MNARAVSSAPVMSAPALAPPGTRSAPPGPPGQRVPLRSLLRTPSRLSLSHQAVFLLYFSKAR